MTMFRASARLLPVSLLSTLALLACGGSTPAGGNGTAGATNGNGGGNTTGGAPGQAGGATTAGMPGSGGSTPGAGAPSFGGDAVSAGAGGTGNPGGGAPPSGGAAGMGMGMAGMGMSMGGTAPGDTPPYRPLNVTAPAGMSLHTGIDSKGNDASVNPGPKMMGKLVVDLGVNQGHQDPFLAAHGFHTMGVKEAVICTAINGSLPGNRAYDGDCRLNTFDGKPHGTQSAVGVADSMMTQVTNNLKTLQTMYPKEDWGYFFTDATNTTVRWSDVAWTGYSHGATTAVLIAMVQRSYRAVAMSGPRDNVCGSGVKSAKAPYDPNCAAASIAAWLDLTPATPLDRFYSFVGTLDSEYGDIMFATNYLKFPGTPMMIPKDNTVPPAGQNRFVAVEGHISFRPAGYTGAVATAFGAAP